MLNAVMALEVTSEQIESLSSGNDSFNATTRSHVALLQPKLISAGILAIPGPKEAGITEFLGT